MINVSDLQMGFGGRSLFRHATFQLQPGRRYGLVGANGTGKTTFLRLLAGAEAADGGVVAIGKDLNVGTLKQNQYLYETETIVNTVLQGDAELWRALQRKARLLEGGSGVDAHCDELAEVERTLEQRQGYASEANAARLLVGLGLRTETHHQPMSTLSGGFKLRVLLAQLLFSAPDVLLLDEPNNHLDIVSIRWLERYLCQFLGTVVVSSHDREFLNVVCTDILDVDYGTVKLYPGNYQQFVTAKAAERERLEALLSRQEKRKEDMQAFVDRFRAKASKARQAQSRVRMIAKLEEEMEELDLQPSSRSYPRFHFSMQRPSGVVALRAFDIGKAYGSHKVLEGVSFEVERGEKVAIIGPNGIGKSTLLKVLMDDLKADHGRHEWGHATTVSYFSQDHDALLDNDKCPLDWLRHAVPGKEEQALRDALGKALFSGDDVLKKIATLSGGEKARLVLSKMMLENSNILVFDEPTNHLDMEAIEALVTALTEYPGTILFVSHNAYFVHRLAGRILEIQPHGIRNFRGSYAEYLNTYDVDYLSKDTLQATASKPQRSADSAADIEERRKTRNRRNQLKRDIETLESRTEQLEQEIAALEAEMASEGFYTRDSKAIRVSVERKEQLEAELHRGVTKWEQLVQELDSCQTPAS